MTQLDANGHVLPPGPAPADREREQIPWTIQRWMVAVASVAILIGVVRSLYLISDATFGGPCTRVFQSRYIHTANEAQLVGRPEADIVGVLGPPTAIDKVDESQDFYATESTRIYRYAPSLVRPGSFLIKCKGGIVRSLDAAP